MKTAEFLELLRSHGGRALNFEYLPGKRLRADYHITEVKNVHIEATDCGGRSDSWKETVIQLWESAVPESANRPITARKALAILDRVHRQQPLLSDSPLKFEYGNGQFHTAQLHVVSHILEADGLIIQLGPEPTQCKASDICGVPAQKAEPEIVCCEPGAGCC